MNESSARPAHIRFVQIDALKGFGILSVVIAHVLSTEHSFDSLTVRLIYMFHMPLFFFLSGYLSSLRTSYKLYFTEKATQLLIPYFIYLVTIFFLIRFAGKSEQSMSRLILGGGYLTGYLGVFWFVPCLFLTQQASNLILSKCSPTATLMVILVCLLSSYANDLYCDNIILPYSINVVLAAIPFYCFGNLYRRFGRDWNLWLLALVAVAGICLTSYGFPNYNNMKVAFYGVPFITFMSGLAILVVLLNFFLRIPSFDLLALLGKGSLVIMYLHQGIQLALDDAGYQNIWLRILIATLVPTLMYLLANQSVIGRAFLLGSLPDQKNVLLSIQSPFLAKSVRN